MFHRTVGILAAALAVGLWAGGAVTAEPESACGERGRVVSRLAAAFGEMPAALGMAGSGRVLEILSSPDGSTWTMLVTEPNGQSCLIAAGEGWEALSPRKIRQ